MLVDSMDRANNRGLDRPARARVYAGLRPCHITSSDAQIQQEQQQEQQQALLAQYSLVRGGQRAKT
jgi:hypothetical protein